MRIRSSLLTAVAMLSLSATAAMSDGLTFVPDLTLKPGGTPPTVHPDLTKPAVKPEVVKPEVVKPGVIKPGVLVDDLVMATADLVVDEVQYIPQLPNLVRVQVTNKGSAISGATSLKTLRWVGGAASSTGTPVEAMHPGQSQIVMAQIGGTYEDATHIYVRVDDPNQVKELNEGNNSYKVK